MSGTVFFSWQSDSPAKTNRTFLERVLKQAIKEIGAEESEFQKAERPLKLDKDTSGVAGSPAIVDVIFEKVRACGVFIPDLTFVGTTPAGRPIQNPNVLIEYGWALAHVGEARIVAVMNTAFGEPSIELMPFDIAHKRWPIRYHLTVEADEEEKKIVKARLVKELKGALIAALSEMPMAVEATVPQLSAKSRQTSFLDGGDLIGRLIRFGDTRKGRDVHWHDEAPQMSLRVLPEAAVPEIKRVDLAEIVSKNRPPFVSPRFISHWDIPNEHGVAVIEATGEEDQTATSRITQVTVWGEIWSIDAITLGQTDEHLLFPEFSYASTLSVLLKFLRDHFSYDGTVTIEAGYAGVLGRSAFLPQLASGYEYQGFDKATGAAVIDEFVTRIPGIAVTVGDTSSLKIDAPELRLPPPETDETHAAFLDAYLKLLPHFDQFWDTLAVPRPKFLPLLVE